MSKILTRGKKRYGKGWAYGVPLELDINGIKVLAIVNGARKSTDGFVLDYDEVLPKTVGRDTGLTDKNGKKIFEGDKIKLTQGIGTVEWFKTQSRFMIWLPKSNKFASFLAGIEYEIIGNIHDNPELLP